MRGTHGGTSKGKLKDVTKKQLIEYLSKDNLTDVDIGLMHGMASRQAVYQLRKKYGIKTSRGSRLFGRNARIRKMRKDNVPVREIAKAFGLSQTQIYRVARAVQKRR